jgi:hypothetical protein
VNDDELLRERPFPLAAALRLRAAGASRDQIAAALDIAPEAVDAELDSPRASSPAASASGHPGSGLE